MMSVNKVTSPERMMSVNKVTSPERERDAQNERRKRTLLLTGVAVVPSMMARVPG
jgi:hypothetical protein